MNKVCWAMIGCGAVTEKKSGPGLYKSQNSTVKTVYARNYERASDFSKRHKIPNTAHSLDEIFADKEINAVYIATPPKSHKEYAISCLETGKIPYIEKPLALNYAECLEIIETAKKVNLPAYVAYYRRGLEKFIYIKSLIDKGLLGKIRFMRITQFMKPEEADFDREKLPWKVRFEETGGGKFIDMGTHIIDLAQYFCGAIRKVNSFVSNFARLYKAEDAVCAIMECESGILISGNWIYCASFNEDEILIIGDKGKIETTGLAYAPVKVLIDGKEEIAEFKEPEHIAMPYQQLIINEIIGKQKSPADILSAANNVRIIDEILREYRDLVENKA